MGAEAFSMDAVHRLEDLGIDEAIIAFRSRCLGERDSQTLEEKTGDLYGFADAVIAHCLVDFQRGPLGRGASNQRRRLGTSRSARIYPIESITRIAALRASQEYFAYRNHCAVRG